MISSYVARALRIYFCLHLVRFYFFKSYPQRQVLEVVDEDLKLSLSGEGHKMI